MFLRACYLINSQKEEEAEAAVAAMAVSLAPIASLCLLTQANKKMGRRSPLALPLAPSFFGTHCFDFHSFCDSRGYRWSAYFGSSIAKHIDWWFSLFCFGLCDFLLRIYSAGIAADMNYFFSFYLFEWGRAKFWIRGCSICLSLWSCRCINFQEH